MNDFTDIVNKRRSIYALGNELTISDDVLIKMIQTISVQMPSAFHSQSTRIVLLLGKQHQKVWDITCDILRQKIDPTKFNQTKEKLDTFKAGYGTILFYDDTSITKDFAQRFVAYKDNFEVWANQSNGMMQFALWSALAQQNIGASLQHYNPLIDEEVSNAFEIPKHFKLVAQMPFGNILKAPEIKVNKSADTMVIVKQ